MEYEDLFLDIARWAREAEAAVTAKLQAGQHGEAFTPKESNHEDRS